MPSFYQKYNLELVKSEQFTDKKVFYEDLDSDGYSEKIITEKFSGFNAIRFYNCDDSVLVQINLKNSITNHELCKFEDYDKNGFKEFYFLTINNDSIFLNAIEYPKFNKFLFKNKFITTIRQNHKGGFDVETANAPASYDMNDDGYKEIYFYISSGYSYYPRKIFAYDIINDTVYASPQNGVTFAPPSFYDFENDNTPELYFTTFATDNFKNEFNINNYPDTSAWLMLLNKNLNFVFKPIEFGPRGSMLQVKPIKNKNKDTADILILHTSFLDNNTTPTAYIYDIKGNLIKQKMILEITNNNIKLIELDFDLSKIYFIDKKGYLYTFNYNIELIKKRNILNLKNQEDIIIGLYDMNNDGEKEILFRHQSGMTVTDINFNHPTFIALENSGLAFPNIVKSKSGDIFFWFKSINNTWYMLKYSKNLQYIYRYFIFAAIFTTLYAILYILMTLRSKMLEADNKRLNQIVEERTHKINSQKNNLDILNQKFLASNVELKEKNKKLLELNKYKQSLSAMIVHDLKNPLNRIISTSKSKNTEAERKLYESSQYMLNLVENILSVTKIEQTGLTVNATAVNLQEIILNAYKSTEFLFKNKGVIFEKQITINYKVLAENEILKRILINLFTNAVKYTISGGKVTVSVKKINDFAHIEVKDTGIGIRQEKLSKIFEIYEHDNLSDEGRVSSTGIGLYFVKNAIKALGSKISVKSEPNKGTGFIFTLKIIEFINKSETIFNFENNDSFQLDIKEKEIIKAIVNDLKNTELYEVTKIKELINQLNTDTENLKSWVKLMNECVANYNTDMFQKLIIIAEV